MLPRLLDACRARRSEFVRPALTSAMAASWRDARVAAGAQAPGACGARIISVGRSSPRWANMGRRSRLPELLAVAGVDGPLQDDAMTALGRAGGPSSLPVVAGLQKTAPPELQPTVSAALCLLGIDCPARIEFVVDTLRYAVDG